MGGMSAVRARLLAAAGATMAATCTSLASSDAGAPLDERGAAVPFLTAPPPRARPDAKLAFVQLLTRHGDRTSINPLPMETREQWSKLLPSSDACASMTASAAPHPPNPALLDAKREAAWHGQLTTKGVDQMRDTGAALREWLVEREGVSVLPPTLEEAVASGAVRIRSTSTRRTVQSAQAMMQGLYGVRDPTSSNGLRVEVRDRMHESMFPNPGMSCRRQIELMKSLDGDHVVKTAEQDAWGRRTLAAVRDLVHARNVDKRRRQREEALRELNAVKDGNAEKSTEGHTMSSIPQSTAGESTVGGEQVEPVPTSASKGELPAHLGRDPRRPSCTSVWEPLQARANHGLSLPEGVTASDVALIRRAAEVRYINRATNMEGAGLTGGRLLRELANEAADVANGKSLQKLSLYSGHDSTIIALLAVLGAFQGEWPPVASTVVVETWKVGDGLGRPHWSSRALKAGEDGDMVRVLFNGEVLPLPGCAGQDPIHRGGLCALDKFVAMADERDPRDYEEACKPRGGSKL